VFSCGVSAREGSSRMLTCILYRNVQGMKGHMMLEVLVSTSLTLIAGAGLWKLVTSTRHLVEAGLEHTEPTCVTPQCSTSDQRVVCVCGERSYVVLR
jgi:siroheme synthase